jgi:hypothetical protein
MLRTIRPRYTALAALVLAAAAVPSAAFATSPVQDPLPIGPNQSFIGLVNGVSSDAVIKMVCPIPLVAGETGHPLGGQTVEVETALTVSTVDGFTGSAATEIEAIFNSPTTASINPPVVFSGYFVQEPIPTTDVFPCSGPGVVSFVPLPTSPTARGYAVSVTFGNITAGS